MAQNFNLKGTLYPSFKIGTDGVTIYQGTSVPGNGTGIDGDAYFYINGTSSTLYIKSSSSWQQASQTLTGVTPGSYTNTNLTVDGYGRITAASSGVSGTGTVTSIVAGTGLTGGTITSSGTLALSVSGVTAGTYVNATVSVDNYGRVTSATSGTGGAGVSGLIAYGDVYGTATLTGPYVERVLSDPALNGIASIAYSSNGLRTYVLGATGSNVVMFDSVTFAPLGTYHIPDAGTNLVQSIAIAQSDTKLLVTMPDPGNPSSGTGGLLVYNITGSNSISLQYNVHTYDHAFYVLSTGSLAYVQTGSNGFFQTLRLEAIDLNTGSVAYDQQYSAGNQSSIAITPNGSKLLAVDGFTTDLTVWSLNGTTGIPVGTGTHYAVADGGGDIAISADSGTAYITAVGTNNSGTGNTLRFVDINAGTLIGTTALGFKPGSVGRSLDGSTLYVSRESGPNVAIVNAATMAIVGTLYTPQIGGQKPNFATGRLWAGAGNTVEVIATSSGTGNLVIDLPLTNTGVIAGTYNNVVVDVKGRITGGTNITSSSTTVVAGTGLTGGTITTTGTINFNAGLGLIIDGTNGVKTKWINTLVDGGAGTSATIGTNVVESGTMYLSRGTSTYTVGTGMALGNTFGITTLNDFGGNSVATITTGTSGHIFYGQGLTGPTYGTSVTIPTGQVFIAIRDGGNNWAVLANTPVTSGTGSVTNITVGSGLGVGSNITNTGTLSVGLVTQGGLSYYSPAAGTSQIKVQNDGATIIYDIPNGYLRVQTQGNGGLNIGTGNGLILQHNNLAAGTALGTADIIAVSQAGTTVRSTLGSLATFVGTSQGATEYEIPFYVQGLPVANVTGDQLVFVRNVTLGSGLSTSRAQASVASTGTANFDIEKNGTSIGSVSFPASAIGTFTFGSTVSFSSGDLLQIITPVVQDLTLKDVSINILGTKS